MTTLTPSSLEAVKTFKRNLVDESDAVIVLSKSHSVMAQTIADSWSDADDLEVTKQGDFVTVSGLTVSDAKVAEALDILCAQEIPFDAACTPILASPCFSERLYGRWTDDGYGAKHVPISDQYVNVEDIVRMAESGHLDSDAIDQLRDAIQVPGGPLAP
ncbi:MAG: hypothetical protein LAT62_15035 [Natronospirillum sp.]|uniref:hypothetical protein n=1 Tax=Natronospirillum sp. TaxID=2812955 RepID=UPI0025DFEE3A|nr:hypothetical protein [Natronospirillum sp.]MCH8553251.1 hypothetical protein [Natronospirillum sp.]